MRNSLECVNPQSSEVSPHFINKLTVLFLLSLMAGLLFLLSSRCNSEGKVVFFCFFPVPLHLLLPLHSPVPIISPLTLISLLLSVCPTTTTTTTNPPPALYRSSFVGS